MQDLKGRVAVVTGGGSGIGAALARAFAAQGMDVAVADIEIAGAEEAAADVRAAGRRALAVQADVSKLASVEAFAERVYRELGGCHVLCNNAGVIVLGSLESRTAKDWEWVLGVNLWGVVHGLLAFLPRMLSQPGEKHIVNTASIAGLIPTPGVGVYATSKYAVVGLSEHLRMDLARHAIGVSVLCPGGVQTQILSSQRNRPEELGAPTAPAEDMRRLTSGSERHPDEMQPPEAIAAAVLEGIRANDAYILTHAHYRGKIEARCAALMRAFDRADARARASSLRPPA
jgi:NAD(P)-dependent dehydrogenase (short-subunit alcohol dehydrogenase family)